MRTPRSMAPTPENLTISLVDLRCQVELQVAVVRALQAVPHEQGRVWAKAELHGAAQRRSLGEIDQVAQRECGSYRLVDGEAHLVLGLLCLAWLQHDVAGAHVALNAEGDALLGGLQLHRLAKLLEVAADLLELRRRQLCDHLVVLLRHLHVLALNLHQLQVEVGDPVVLPALALEAHEVCVVLPAQLQRVVLPAHLQDLAQ
mmetsp:Transcript_88626/g.250878  ORF Transcript_88626/g.250878 Transcript_88626/m.250878 type:complete len:202 (-) Transcript_88626:305-910(-)